MQKNGGQKTRVMIKRVDKMNEDIKKKWRLDKEGYPYAICPKCDAQIRKLDVYDRVCGIYPDKRFYPRMLVDERYYDEPKYLCPECNSVIAESTDEAIALFQKPNDKKEVDEMNDDHLVTISIRLSTRQRLKAFGILAYTYDSVINKLLDIAEARTASAEHGNMHADELGGDLYTTWEGREDD